MTLAEAEGSARELGVEIKEVVTDKGYDSDDVVVGLGERGMRSYVSEPDRGRRRWEGKREEQRQVYGNRRRKRGERGRGLHGEPLRDSETIVQLIANTTTAEGLKVTCRIDHRRYPVGRKVTNAEFATVSLFRNRFHGDWNYTIRPHRQS